MNAWQILESERYHRAANHNYVKMLRNHYYTRYGIGYNQIVAWWMAATSWLRHNEVPSKQRWNQVGEEEKVEEAQKPGKVEKVDHKMKHMQGKGKKQAKKKWERRELTSVADGLRVPCYTGLLGYSVSRMSLCLCIRRIPHRVLALVWRTMDTCRAKTLRESVCRNAGPLSQNWWRRHRTCFPFNSMPLLSVAFGQKREYWRREIRGPTLR